MIRQANNEGDKCAMCERGKGEVPICDEDSNKTLWICEYCDSEMFDNSLESKGLKPKSKIAFERETLFKVLLEEIDTQIKHHKEEKNNPAISSLEYIKSILVK